jgi:hypothetical protein
MSQGETPCVEKPSLCYLPGGLAGHLGDSVAALLLELSEKNKRLAEQVGALATLVSQLKEEKGRSSRNSS